ncbi:DUF2853 family protein [Bartonella ancashensis]|uniref:DUF2853 family protein n=1 Tax=Bartonella ancashensis TaxID=1318743 RepID=A0A0M4LJT7_9HYPH|nr:hypothetical protein PU02_0825 [Bartonella ancashensis]
MDSLEDIKSYDPKPDEDAIKRLERRLALAMRDRDASLVSVSDQKELRRVEKWTQNTLDVSEENAKEAVSKVSEMMSGSNRKNRVTFYYMVAKELNALGKV